jgi:predicted O-methyltransferase YrrM
VTAVAAPAFVYPADIDSSTTEAECRRLWELAQGQTVLELGAWKGRTTVTMAQSAKTVHAVDRFTGDQHTGYANTLGDYLKSILRYGVQDNVVTHIGRFKDIIRVLKPKSFGLVFCDGEHTAEATELQARWAQDLVTDGGVIAFHDYAVEEQIPEAKTAGFAVTEVVDTLYPSIELVDTLAIIQL